MKSFLYSIILINFIFSMTGCITVVKKPVIDRAEIERIMSEGVSSDDDLVKYADDPQEGSLWAPHNSRSFLFVDSKAQNINDIVTVRIMEEADATSNANTKVSKKSGLKSSILKFFGSDLTFGMHNLWGKKTGAATAAERTETPFKPEIETLLENSFNGKGSTVRKEKLLATISAKVVDVYPNGNLFIRGKREVSINNEKQYIHLSGIVRPEDISSSNVLISSAIADAKISISGSGVIADKQDPGNGHRIFDWIWPF